MFWYSIVAHPCCHGILAIKWGWWWWENLFGLLKWDSSGGWMPFLLPNQQRQSTEGMLEVFVYQLIILVLLWIISGAVFTAVWGEPSKNGMADPNMVNIAVQCACMHHVRCRHTGCWIQTTWVYLVWPLTMDLTASWTSMIHHMSAMPLVSLRSPCRN